MFQANSAVRRIQALLQTVVVTATREKFSSVKSDELELEFIVTDVGVGRVRRKAAVRLAMLNNDIFHNYRNHFLQKM